MAAVATSVSGGHASTSDGSSSQVAAAVPFQDFCGLLERVYSTSGTERKKTLLERFIRQWRDTHQKVHSSDAATTSDTFYPAMRLLLPHLDRQRPAYGMKETALAKHYINILNIAKESSDAKKLLNYRAPHTAKQDAGDFAAVAYYVLRNRCPEKGSLSVAQVNNYLDQMAMSNLKKERAGMKKAMQLLLRNTSAQEQKWLIRIIMKELKTGLSENSVFAVFHPDAVDLFSVCSSLEKVCSDLRNPSTRLNEASISYFTPFRPMLGQRAGIDQVLRLMDHQPFFIETKFDGERMQVHKQGDQYRYYSRSSKDYTKVFGASEHEGSFTPNIHAAFNSKVKSCILDGEMVVWDTETESYRPKGDNVDVKTLLPGDESGAQPCLVVFDVLLINDTPLANCPLRERASHLKKIFEPVSGFLHMVEQCEGNSKEDVIMALNQAIDRCEEGLLVKHPGSTYRPDKRKGSGWLKIKPEYVDSLSDQLDLVIVGGYYGVGKRAGMISHFLCAVAVPPHAPGGKPTLFHSFCKVGSGYSMKELRELGHKLRDHWRKCDPKNPPESVLFSPGIKEKPDVLIEPRHSKIVQIRAAEIIASDKYKCGCTLRFPRLELIREDKEWYDAMTVDELESLKLIASGHLAHQHYDDEGKELPPSKKMRGGSGAGRRMERPRGVAAQFRRTDVSDVKEVSKMFQDKEFCVLSCPPGMSKEMMEKKITEHGGSFVQNPTEATFAVLVHRMVLKAKNIISKGSHDVVKAEWLSLCLDAGKLLPFKPSMMLHASLETRTKLAEIYDKYGDSYEEDCSEQTLYQVFEEVVEKHGTVKCSPMEMAEIEERYFPSDSGYGIFRHCRFYLDKYDTSSPAHAVIATSPLELSELQARLYGGVVCDTLDEAVTHVVVHKSDLTRMGHLRRVEKSHKRKHHFVLSDWIEDCIESKGLRSERLYEPRAPSIL